MTGRRLEPNLVCVHKLLQDLLVNLTRGVRPHVVPVVHLALREEVDLEEEVMLLAFVVFVGMEFVEIILFNFN